MPVSNQPAVIAGTSQAVNRDESKVNISLLIERRSALNGLKLWAVNQAVYEIMLANNRAYIELVEINVKRAEIEPLVQSAINIMPCIRPIDQSVKAVAD